MHRIWALWVRMKICIFQVIAPKSFELSWRDTTITSARADLPLLPCLTLRGSAITKKDMWDSWSCCCFVVSAAAWLAAGSVGISVSASLEISLSCWTHCQNNSRTELVSRSSHLDPWDCVALGFQKKKKANKKLMRCRSCQLVLWDHPRTCYCGRTHQTRHNNGKTSSNEHLITLCMEYF